MKKSRNFIISSLVALTGATLASSVTGTVAWFQYATSASVAYTGTTASCSKLLQVKVGNGEWGTDVVVGDSNPTEFLPVTSGPMVSNGQLPAKMYLGPSYRKDSYEDWGSATANVQYQQFTLGIRFNDVSDGTPGTPESADICLSDLTIANAGSTDIAGAIRVHLSVGNNNYLFSRSGGSLAVCGRLDLNNDGALDVDGYEFQAERNPIYYGGQNKVQVSYAENNDSIIGSVLGNTNGGVLEITVTVWVEGWALLNTGVTGNAQASNTAVWDKATYTSNNFHVGMTFDVVEQ